MNDNFQGHVAVLCYSAARKTKVRQYITRAQKCHAHIRTIGRKGNPNLSFMEKLLDAEAAALNGKKREAKLGYEAATVVAARGGFVGQQAIICERYANFLFHDLSDKIEARYQFDRALELYKEWGAVVKVKYLQERVKDTFELTTSRDFASSHELSLAP